MNKRKPFRIEKQKTAGTAMALRISYGEAAEIARELGVNRSTVSRVAAGLKTSERVSLAIIRYLLKKSERAIVSERAGTSCGPREMGAR